MLANVRPEFFMATILLGLWTGTPLVDAQTPLDPSRPILSSLAPAPDWRLLDSHQKSITHDEFEKRVRRIYSRDGAFFNYLDLNKERVIVYRDTAKTVPLWTLHFAATPGETTSHPVWFSPASTSFLRKATTEKPLKGLRILLDPGHIGGEWAQMEERWMKIGNNPPVMEAELNTITCRILERLLREKGAEVLWTRKNFQPVTKKRPIDLEADALRLIMERDPRASQMPRDRLTQLVKRRAEALFYRTAEIQARAEVVAKLRPDLILCVHFNAAPDPNFRRSSLLGENRLVVFTHGSYMAEEVVFDDMKYSLLQKLLERSSEAETALSNLIGEEMERTWKLPPEIYEGWNAVHRVSDNPYVFSRNLLANRLFVGPVIFIEGPYMNNRQTYPRLIAGDYEGVREIDGIPQRSIFREFAELITRAVVRYAQPDRPL
jgi:N-acetylmuramoyl-L-alanine amidase